METRSTINNSERIEKTNYWEELLKDSYEVHKVEEFNALGKGKRSRKQVLLCSLSIIFGKTHLLVIIKNLNLLGMRLYAIFHLQPVWNQFGQKLNSNLLKVGVQNFLLCLSVIFSH